MTGLPTSSVFQSNFHAILTRSRGRTIGYGMESGRKRRFNVRTKKTADRPSAPHLFLLLASLRSCNRWACH